MSQNDTDILFALSKAVEESVGPDRFSLWFGSIAKLSLRENQLVVTVPDSFVRDLIVTQFDKELKAAIASLADYNVSIAYMVQENAQENEQATVPADSAVSNSVDSNNATSIKLCEEVASNSEAVSQQTVAQKSLPGMDAAVLLPTAEKKRAVRRSRTARRRANQNSSANRPAAPMFAKPKCTLDGFVSGPSNTLAFAAAKQTVAQPGRCSPILLHGSTATGKTHLLEGIRAEVRKCYPRMNALYLTAETFTSSYVDALNRRELPSLRNKFRGVDLFLIDDIQFLVGKRATLIEFQYTIDTLLRAGKQIVITADRPPRDLFGLGEEIISRLTSGLVCELGTPEFETRCLITRRLADQLGLQLSNDILNLVATHVATNAREISGALHRLQAVQTASGKTISHATAEGILTEMAQQNAPSVGLSQIEQAVCEVFGMGSQTLKSRRTAAGIAAGRTLAMWLARKYTRAALSEIGHYFGRRSHSTVISASKRVASWVSDETTVQLGDRTCNVEEAIRRIEDRLRHA